MATIKGTEKVETKYGTTAADLIYGYGGNDTLFGDAGNDKIYGGTGDDKLFGDAGTDTIYGEAGNDVIKGGTGISYLYGGAGLDTLHYDPTASDMYTLGNYLAPSVLEGEKVYLYNNSTASGAATRMQVWYGEHDQGNDGHIRFWDTAKGNFIEGGTLIGRPEIVAAGKGGIEIDGPDFATQVFKVTGTDANDAFYGGYGPDSFKGGAGNDDFFIRGGDDLIFSEINDADSFHFMPNAYGTNTTVTGFNGQGVAGGDVLYIGGVSGDPLVPGDVKIIQENGKTTFTVDDDPVAPSLITIDKVGLVENVDYFIDYMLG